MQSYMPFIILMLIGCCTLIGSFAWSKKLDQLVVQATHEIWAAKAEADDIAVGSLHLVDATRPATLKELHSRIAEYGPFRFVAMNTVIRGVKSRDAAHGLRAERDINGQIIGARPYLTLIDYDRRHAF